MKVTYALTFVLFISMLGSVLAKEQQKAIELGMMSFNIRNGHAKDGENRWALRKGLVKAVILKKSPDIIGLQEAFRFQMNYLNSELPEYAEVGVGRDGGKRGEYSAILYRKKQFELLKDGTFWLSNTPDKPSRHWGNRYLRICTWALFIEKETLRQFYVYNTHFDHQSQPAREKSVQLIMKHIKEHAVKVPVILTGDFNADENNNVIQYIRGQERLGEMNPIPLIDTFRKIHPNETIVGTGNGGYKGKVDGARIDYIFVRPGIDVLSAEIIRDKVDERYPSDHYPVMAKVRL